MFKIGGTIVINRPIEEVFAFLTTPGNSVLWQGNVVGATQTSEGPRDVGTTGQVTAQFLGKTIESNWEITEHELNRKTALKSTSGPITYEQSTTLE